MILVSTRQHTITDYVLGLVLLAAPWLLGFADAGAATFTPVFVGMGIIAFALLANHRYGLARVLSLQTELIADILLGAFLAVSPWLLGFSSYVYAPHLIVGLVIVLAAMMTVREPHRIVVTRTKTHLRHSV